MFLPRQYLPNTLRAPACLRPDYSIVTTPYSITLMLLSENTTHQPRKKPRKNLPTSPILGMTGRSRNDWMVKRSKLPGTSLASPTSALLIAARPLYADHAPTLPSPATRSEQSGSKSRAGGFPNQRYGPPQTVSAR